MPRVAAHERFIPKIYCLIALALQFSYYEFNILVDVYIVSLFEYKRN